MGLAQARPKFIFSMKNPTRGEEGHRRKADGNGNDAAASSTLRGHVARRCRRIDTETAGQIEARLEANAAEWRKATGLSDGQAASVQA